MTGVVDQQRWCLVDATVELQVLLVVNRDPIESIAWVGDVVQTPRSHFFLFVWQMEYLPDVDFQDGEVGGRDLVGEPTLPTPYRHN
jgi:hypothetical protein